MNSLKPCPFCGARAETGDTVNGSVVVFCVNPRCGVYHEDYIRWTGNEWEVSISAEDKWNSRID